MLSSSSSSMWNQPSCLVNYAFYFFHNLKFYIVVTISAVQQTDSIIHILSSILFQVLFPCRLSQPTLNSEN